MEIREITTYNEKAPFSGYGIWIVWEMKYRKAHLLHPVHLTELILSEYEYVKSSGNMLYPFNQTKTSFNLERFKKSFKERVQFFVEHHRTFPVQLVSKVIAELDSTSEEEAIKIIGDFSSDGEGHTTALFDKANRTYCLSKDADISTFRGRQRVILNAFEENGPSSIYQITNLVDGRLKTKSKISRVVTYFVHRLTYQGILNIV
jgi:hypothetical protein